MGALYPYRVSVGCRLIAVHVYTYVFVHRHDVSVHRHDVSVHNVRIENPSVLCFFPPSLPQA